MARTITVDFDDGTQHVYQNAPDDMTPEVVTERATREFGKKVARLDGGKGTEPKAGFLESTGRDLLSGFGMAASMAPRAAGFLARAVPGGEPLVQGLNDVADSAESYWKGVGDKSTNNVWGQKAARGVGGALTAGAPGLVNVAAGAGAGIGDQAAEQFSNGNPSPLLRVAGSVAGGVLAGTGAALASRVRPQSAELAADVRGTLTDAQLLTAQKYMNDSAKRGQSMDLVQALIATNQTAEGLEAVRNYLAGRNSGRQVTAMLRKQPQELAQEARLTINGLPGANYGKDQSANIVQETAGGRLQQVKDARKAAVEGLYAKAGNISPEYRNELIRLAQKDAARPGASEVLKGKVADFVQKLQGEDGGKLVRQLEAARANLDAASTPLERTAARQQLAKLNELASSQQSSPVPALTVDRGISELRGPYQGGTPLKISHPYEAGEIKGLAGQLNKRFQELSPEVAAAEAKFQQMTQDVVNPVKQGPIGKLNQAGGPNPETQAQVSRFSGLMSEGSDINSSNSPIRTAAKELGKVDPAAFEGAFKSHLSDKLEGIAIPGEGAHPLPTVEPEKFFRTFFENAKQWQGLKDATAAMAEVRGVAPESMVRGLENLRQLTYALRSRPASMGGIAASDIERTGGHSNTANLVRIASFLPANRLGEGIERLVLGKTLAQFDTILTSPEGAKMLIELGKVPVMSRKAQVILGTWGSTMGNSPGLQSGNPPE